jgi:predicted CoA-binding protein
MDTDARIDVFLAGSPHAVVGASKDREKYGNKVLRAYLQHDMKVYAVNPRESEIEGVDCYADLGSLPEPVHGISVITPPAVTAEVIERAAAAGIKHVWMQPGSDSPEILERAEQLGLIAVGGGPCILVKLGYRE